MYFSCVVAGVLTAHVTFSLLHRCNTVLSRDLHSWEAASGLTELPGLVPCFSILRLLVPPS